MTIDKEIIALICAILAGVISLIVALLNYKATRRLEFSKRSFELTKYDLEKLTSLFEELCEIPIGKSDDEVYEAFMITSKIMMKNKYLFKEEIQKQIEEKFLNADASKRKDKIYAYISWSANAVADNIEETRVQWKTHT